MARAILYSAVLPPKRPSAERVMTAIAIDTLVTVFGGSGFVGRYIVWNLARRGYRIRAAVRRPELAGHLQPMGVVGQIFPAFAGFRGGKGAATTLGGYIGVAPVLAVIGLVSWGIGLLVIRRAVLSTVTAIVALAVVTVVLQQHAIFGIGSAALTLIAHRNDIVAWRRGEMPTIRDALRDNRHQ